MAANPARQLLRVMGEHILTLWLPCNSTAIEEKALPFLVDIDQRGETLNAPISFLSPHPKLDKGGKFQLTAP